MVLRDQSRDVQAYAAHPVAPEELGSDEDPLAWDVEAWP